MIRGQNIPNSSVPEVQKLDAKAYSIELQRHEATYNHNNIHAPESDKETVTSVGVLVLGAAEKTTPVDADMLPVMDSEDSNVLKKLSWANIKTALGVIFMSISNMTFGTDTDYTEFEADGFVKHVGSSKYWKDVDFPIIIRTTGTGIPTLTTLNGNLTAPQWATNDYNQCEAQELVHAWEEGSAVYWHVHLTTNGLDTTDRYVRFEVEYGYCTPDGAWVFPATLDSGDILIPANTQTKTMKILSLGNFTPTNVRIGGHCIARLKRIAATGTAPTANPWVPMLQLHILCDTEGSREISTK